MNGLIRCRKRCAPVGIVSSFVIILITSASGWIRPSALKPRMLARFAPMRSCISALCLRSTQVMIGANTSSTSAKRKIETQTVDVAI